MGSIASWSLQQAIYTRLGANANTSSYTVTDNTDQDTLPYISLGATTSVEVANRSEDGSDETVTIHVWAANSKDCKQIANNIDTALKASPVLDLTSDGFTVLQRPRRELFEVFTEDDPETGDEIRHGVLRYRYMISGA